MKTETNRLCGRVHIVGAGPGPVDLLTLRALQRIEAAEVVVHDRLIDAEVLARVPAHAQRIYVGKASGDHAMSQDEIHAVLIEQARAGRRVVRLKGGDPFVFGRGGEEVQAIQDAGIAVEVVPGVTAATGCASAAGIPLTHRDMAHSCVFLPGHLAGGETQLDWSALARPGQTRVFYMGVARLASIAQSLIEHGLSPETPAAIVQDGTRDGQVVLATALSALVDKAPAYGPRPGLLIIGETVRLCPQYQLTPRSIAPVDVPAPTPASGAGGFSAEERASFYRLIEARRDMRHFVSGAEVEADTFQRLLEAAHCAPSVGLMQPWRFLRVTEGALREGIAELVEAERQATADALGARRADFLRLKVEGVRDCAELLVAALAPDDGTLFGRRTLPRETALCSLACAIENLWLAARAENLGMGWVSLFDPGGLARLLEMPEGAQPIGVLCLGPVHHFYDGPMLENEGWRQRRPLSEMVYADRWGHTAPCQAGAPPT